MTELVFVDANIIVYATGKESPFRSRALNFLESIGRGEVEACADSEVFQELLHHFRGDRPRGLKAFDWLRGLVDIVYPVTLDDVIFMRELFAKYPTLSTRDLVHIAVMHHHGVIKIASYDTDYDSVPLVERIEP
ncbi:type II toxin-antitoxin system VapC family toxin [bacterium]|nr:type II toxin-antitoxin system VapC family toxin [bacterium]